jgi:hypothetical protein
VSEGFFCLTQAVSMVSLPSATVGALSIISNDWARPVPEQREISRDDLPLLHDR